MMKCPVVFSMLMFTVAADERTSKTALIARKVELLHELAVVEEKLATRSVRYHETAPSNEVGENPAVCGDAMPTAAVNNREFEYCEILVGKVVGENMQYTAWKSDHYPAERKYCDPLNRITVEEIAEVFPGDWHVRNGPRFWTLDCAGRTKRQYASHQNISDEAPRTIKEGTSDEMEFAVAAIITAPMPESYIAALNDDEEGTLNHNLTGGLGGGAYSDTIEIKRDLTVGWEEGHRVFALKDPKGGQYYMQSYSIQYLAGQDENTLLDLGSKLSLPEGWTYDSYILDKDVVAYGSKGVNRILQDDFENSYTPLDTNPKPGQAF